MTLGARFPRGAIEVAPRSKKSIPALEDFPKSLRMAIVKGLPRVREKNSRALACWLRRVIKNQVRDWEKSRCRKNPPRVVSLGRTHSPEPAASTPTPSSILLSKEASDQLNRAIDAVPPRYRPVLQFIRDKNPDPAELAAFAGKEPEAARKFAGRALTHLLKALGG